MFQDLSSKIEGFYDLYDAQQKELLAEIRNRANENKSKFFEYIDGLGYGFENNRQVFHEAIWDAPVGFEDWIFEEQVKLIEAAEAGDEGAVLDLVGFMFLCQIETTDKGFYKKSSAFLLSKFDSPLPAVREHCSEGLFDLADAEKRNLTGEEVKALRNLLNDKNFKVKYYTFLNLKDYNLLPPGFQFSFFEKLRLRLTGRGDVLK